MAKEISGYNINQDDLPWWAIGVLVWIAMAQSFGEGFGKNIRTWRDGFKRILEDRPPEELYAYYKGFAAYQQSVANGSEDR